MSGLPPYSNRVAYKVALLAALREAVVDAGADYADVQITYGDPGDQLRPDTIVIDHQPLGTLEPSTLGANVSHKDVFAFTVWIVSDTRGGVTPEAGRIAADERCEQLVGLVQECSMLTAKRPQLPGTTARLGDYAGPASSEPDGANPRSEATVTLVVTTNIRAI